MDHWGSRVIKTGTGDAHLAHNDSPLPTFELPSLAVLPEGLVRIHCMARRLETVGLPDTQAFFVVLQGALWYIWVLYTSCKMA